MFVYTDCFLRETFDMLTLVHQGFKGKNAPGL